MNGVIISRSCSTSTSMRSPICTSAGFAKGAEEAAMGDEEKEEKEEDELM